MADTLRDALKAVWTELDEQADRDLENDLSGSAAWCLGMRDKIDAASQLAAEAEADHAAEVQRLREEVERLKAIKLPMGNDSHSQQARAWEKVYEALRKAGIESFLGTMVCGSAQRAVEFIDQLAAAEARAERLEALYRECRAREFEPTHAHEREWETEEQEAYRVEQNKLAKAKHDAATEAAIAATKAEEKKQ